MAAPAMHFSQVGVESLVYVLPEAVVTSVALERRLEPVYERFGLHQGRLELMTGIRERRFWKPGTMPSDGSTQAGRLAMQQGGLDPDDIGVLIHAAVSRDYLEPATAAVVHHNLGLPAGCGFFDISNACLGFLNGMITVAGMIESGQIERGLVVAGENSRPLVETTIQTLLQDSNLSRRRLKDAFASLTIGSGAAAAVLCRRSLSDRAHPLLGGVVLAATEHAALCQGSGDSGFGHDAAMLMSTDSEALLNAGCRLAGQTWEAFIAALSWTEAPPDRCCTHQVGVAHRDRLYEAIDRDPCRDFTTVEFLGNVGSVSLPLTMAMGAEQHPPARGERIAMLGIGSGLSCMMLGVEW